MEEMIVNKAFATVMDENITMVDDDRVTVEMANKTPLDHMTTSKHQQDLDTNALPLISPK